MLRLILLRFWPVLVPVAAYLAWLAHRRRVARRQGTPPPPITAGAAWWVSVCSLVILIACFIWLGLTEEKEGGDYVPAQLRDGHVVSGGVSRP